jgi:hypothetical protein
MPSGGTLPDEQNFSNHRMLPKVTFLNREKNS